VFSLFSIMIGPGERFQLTPVIGISFAMVIARIRLSTPQAALTSAPNFTTVVTMDELHGSSAHTVTTWAPRTDGSASLKTHPSCTVNDAPDLERQTGIQSTPTLGISKVQVV